MILNYQDLQRLAIYYFCDKDGIVDEYISCFLDDLMKNCEALIVICNGKLTSESRKKFEKITPNILVREKVGVDTAAYYEVIEYFGWEYLTQFDEVIFTGYNVFGPLYPLKNMFDQMNTRNVDFWGITQYYDTSFDPYIFDRHKDIPAYVQTYFLAVRKHLLASLEFQQYWKNLPIFESADDMFRQHEIKFTKTFENMGFRWQVYADIADFKEGSRNPIQMDPLYLVKNKKCPLIERKSFFANYAEFLESNNGESTTELVEFIESNLDFNMDMVWSNLIRTQNMADLKDCLHLTYILPTKVSEPLKKNNIKIALIIHLFFEDLIEYCYQYALSMPDNSDIYISTNTEEKRQKIEEVFKQIKCHKLTVLVINNQGRDVSALLVAPKSYIMNYDYACFVHSKKSSYMSSITGASWRYKCFENLLKSKKFVKNIIATFENNPRLGLLVPPPPSHADYFSTIGFGEWGENYPNVVKLAEKLKLNVDIDENKEPIAPLGSMFWFRPKAMKVMYDQDWDYADFPEGDLASDGTLHHSIERIHPFVVQHEGYYPAYILSDDFARIENTNLNFMMRHLNRELFKYYGLNSHQGLIQTITYKANTGPESKQKPLKKMLLRLKRAYNRIILRRY